MQALYALILVCLSLHAVAMPLDTDWTDGLDSNTAAVKRPSSIPEPDLPFTARSEACGLLGDPFAGAFVEVACDANATGTVSVVPPVGPSIEGIEFIDSDLTTPVDTYGSSWESPYF